MLAMTPNPQESQGSGYSHGQGQWMGMPGYQSSSHAPPTQMSDYHHGGYDYAPPAMPMEPAYSMPLRPPHFAGSHPLPPPPLIMPHTALWPSMLTGNQSSVSSSSSYHQPHILPALPVHTPLSAGSNQTPVDITPTSAKSNSSRRKLTDDERRQMCVEAEQNPGMKQTQIGAKFNVERSTVSKILRHREKYMNPPLKEEATSPVKKSKVKMPDIERALINWARNEQKKGTTLTDEKLKKQARFFATTSPTSESQQQITSSGWLEQFKQKYTIKTSHKKSRSGSVTIAIVDSSTTSLSDTPIDRSPVSSVGLASPPISPDDIIGQSNGEGADDFFDYANKARFRDTTSLEHVLARDLESSVVISPVSPDMGRIDSADGDDHPSLASNFLRQRSQTFPVIDMEINGSSRPASSHSKNHSVPIRSMSSDILDEPTSINPRHTVKRHKSVPDIHDPEQVHFSPMAPPPLPRSLEGSPIIGGGSSPTPAEAQNALDVLKSFFQSQQRTHIVNDGDAYIMIGKLMEKLKLFQRPENDLQLPGGMHSLDMIIDSARGTKKRAITGISE